MCEYFQKHILMSLRTRATSLGHNHPRSSRTVRKRVNTFYESLILYRLEYKEYYFQFLPILDMHILR